MKKMILAVVTVALFISAYSQQTLSNQEISLIIEKSKEFNVKNGVVDPNKILPGQKLTFSFQDGTTNSIVVEPGDSQWFILKNKINQLVTEHGDIVPFKEQEKNPAVPENTSVPTPLESSWWDRNSLFLMITILVLGLLGLVIFLRKDWRKKRDAVLKDPITSGTPFVQTGVREANARTYMNEVAQRRFGPGVIVRDVVRGRLSGKNVEVYYAGEITPQRKTFQSIVAYRGTVDVNNSTEFVYFLQGCGNDVRCGNYFKGQDIQFIVDVKQPEELQQPVNETSPAAGVSQTDITQVIKSLTETMRYKDSGTLKLQCGEIKIDLVFSNTEKKIPASNGESKKENVTEAGVH